MEVTNMTLNDFLAAYRAALINRFPAVWTEGAKLDRFIYTIECNIDPDMPRREGFGIWEPRGNGLAQDAWHLAGGKGEVTLPRLRNLAKGEAPDPDTPSLPSPKDTSMLEELMLALPGMASQLKLPFNHIVDVFPSSGELAIAFDMRSGRDVARAYGITTRQVHQMHLKTGVPRTTYLAVVQFVAQSIYWPQQTAELFDISEGLVHYIKILASNSNPTGRGNELTSGGNNAHS